jgi:epoxyqueuosine reductase
VAPAGELGEARAALARWLDAGRHGGMGWLEEYREVLAAADRLLPGAKSVVCVLADYGPATRDEPPPPPEEPRGRVARYARGRDYHVVFANRLKKLGRTLAALAPGVRWKPAADSKPILERAYAWRAGLGFLAKNSMLITPGVGSYTLLGELVTDLALPPDEPVDGTCGRCTRCLDACPTGAIVAEGVVDSRRCISYWTLETVGELPPEAELHGYAVGCDLCQEVCPYNQADPRGRELGADFASPRAPGAWVTAARFEGVADDREFEARFGGTVLMRPGREGMKRNLAALRGLPTFPRRP